MNFVEATEVQEKLISIVLAGRDLVGESKTGVQGKPTLFITDFQKMNEDADNVQAVITALGRELATQICRAARQIATFSDKEIQ